jgi:hypothetical protein
MPLSCLESASDRLSATFSDLSSELHEVAYKLSHIKIPLAKDTSFAMQDAIRDLEKAGNSWAEVSITKCTKRYG